MKVEIQTWANFHNNAVDAIEIHFPEKGKGYTRKDVKPLITALQKTLKNFAIQQTGK